MKVTIQYFDGCPNWTVASARLTDAVRIVGRTDVDVLLEAVETPEAAERLRFAGSPTLLFDGHDPFATESASFGLSCRRFATEAGPDGAPSVAQLVAVLTP